MTILDDPSDESLILTQVVQILEEVSHEPHQLSFL